MAIPIVSVDYAAILVASIVGIIISFILFGPVFGKTWMKVMKVSAKDMAKGKKNMPKNMVGYFIALLVMNFALAHMLAYAGASTVAEALMGGFWLWLGFVATVLFAGWLWEKTPTKMFLINAFNYFVVLLVSSAIIVSM